MINDELIGYLGDDMIFLCYDEVVTWSCFDQWGDITLLWWIEGHDVFVITSDMTLVWPSYNDMTLLWSILWHDLTVVSEIDVVSSACYEYMTYWDHYIGMTFPWYL